MDTPLFGQSRLYQGGATAPHSKVIAIDMRNASGNYQLADPDDPIKLQEDL